MSQKPNTQSVQNALSKIRAHKRFLRSPLMSAFLAYVVSETLAGRESRISAYSVAVDALGKPMDFDPQRNPSVRVLAKRLRDTLVRYHEEETSYSVSIDMEPGSYVPTFHIVDPSQTAHESQNRRIPWTTPVLQYHSEHTC